MNLIILTLEFDPSTGNFHTDLLDSLSLSHTILGFEPHFFEQNGRFFWTLCVNCQARISPEVHFQEQEKGKSTSKDSPCLKELKTWRNQRAKKTRLSSLYHRLKLPTTGNRIPASSKLEWAFGHQRLWKKEGSTLRTRNPGNS